MSYSNYTNIKGYILDRIEDAELDLVPFGHVYIDHIFPENFYAEIRDFMLNVKKSQSTEDRLQDNPKFKNKRFNLKNNNQECIKTLELLFSDFQIKKKLLDKFYLKMTQNEVDDVHIHLDEFEFTFTAGHRFQNIHVDIPPKFLSFVFYFPEFPCAEEEEYLNATILYDLDLMPVYKARYKENSLCVFAPHFCSYHGFSSSIHRDVLVMFYIEDELLHDWRTMRRSGLDEKPYEGIRKLIFQKIQKFPMNEFANDMNLIKELEKKCLINAPQGRIIRDDTLRVE